MIKQLARTPNMLAINLGIASNWRFMRNLLTIGLFKKHISVSCSHKSLFFYPSLFLSLKILDDDITFRSPWSTTYMAGRQLAVEVDKFLATKILSSSLKLLCYTPCVVRISHESVTNLHCHGLWPSNSFANAHSTQR